jgi:prepilin-type N-terminal cleavage/methylation domain-containing protein
MDGNKMRNKNGFTLIESMVAMTVLLIGILGVMAMQYYAITGNASSRELRTATSLTAELIDQLLGTPYDNMVTLGNQTEAPLTVGDFDTESSFAAATGGISFSRAYWIAGGCTRIISTPDNLCAGSADNFTCDAANLTTAPISVIRAKTCWIDRNGINHSVAITRKRTDLL